MSEKAKISKPNPDGRNTGIVTFELQKLNDKWLVEDVDFDTDERAMQRHYEFLQNHPDAVKVPATPPAASASTLSRPVPFEVGATLFADGDRITIDEVHGTAETMKRNNVYEVKGTYRLASRDKASLYAGVTDDGSQTNGLISPGPVVVSRSPREQFIWQNDTSSSTIERGEGKFTLLLKMLQDGKPHVSFYPEQGDGFGHIYFGTGDSVLKKGWWEK
jgi:hypothetical protein